MQRVGGKVKVYPCWYNECESCGDWTVEAGLTCSLDSLNKKQGNYAVKISKPAAVYLPKAYKSVNQCADYIGFWVRVNKISVDSSLAVRFTKTSDGSYVQIYFGEAAGVSVYQFGVYDPTHGTATSSNYAYTSLTWLWIEFYIIAGTVGVWVNGANVWTFSGWQVYPVDQIQVRDESTLRTWDCWLDWIRCSPSEEYPPTYP
jgi:hypothetical protein